MIPIATGSSLQLVHFQIITMAMMAAKHDLIIAKPHLKDSGVTETSLWGI